MGNEQIDAALRAAAEMRILHSENRADILSRLTAATTAIHALSQVQRDAAPQAAGLRGVIESLAGSSRAPQAALATLQTRVAEIASSALGEIRAAEAAMLSQPLSPIPRLAGDPACAPGTEATIPTLEWDEPSRDIAPQSCLDALYVVGLVEGQSRRYRVHNPVTELRRRGLAAAAIDLDHVDAALDAGLTARRLVLFRGNWTDAFDRLSQRVRSDGGQVFADVDDLVFEPQSIGFVHAIAGWPQSSLDWFADNMRRFRRGLQLADGVVVTTPFLAERVRRIQPVVKVAPNTLNAAQMRIVNAETGKAPFNPERIVLGYLSGTATHQADFAQASSAIAAIMRRHPGVRLMIVGPLALSDELEASSDRIERHDLVAYLDMLRLLREIDINLAPLELGNPFCDAKSELKIFEAGAMWTPTVASPTATYLRAIDPGIDGWLAGSASDWFEILNGLVSDPARVAAVGAAARRRALAQFSPEAGVKATLAAIGLDDAPR